MAAINPGRFRLLCTLFLSSLLLLGCSDGSDDRIAAGDISYRAEVVWTEYGIPHVTADNLGSMGYGYGYAIARDNFCVLMKEVIRSNGDSARYLGEDGNLEEDFVYKLYNTDGYIRDEFIEKQDFADLLSGFTAGVNRYLEETGVDNLAQGDEGCRGEEWVRPWTDTDLGKLLRKLALRASTGRGVLTRAISAQDGPDSLMAIRTRQNQPGTVPLITRQLQIAENTIRDLQPKPELLGSNAYGVGGNNSRNGNGLLLGNPHFPWAGVERFYMVHLTIPGVYDAMGASLMGFPLVNIGFNKDVAWSHTVSTARRFTLYEITLDPADPMKYIYDGETRDIETETVTAERKLSDGTVESVEHTFYLTQFGPVLDLSGPTGVDLLGEWPTELGTVYAIKDVNLFNTRGLDTWLGMGQAESLQELVQAHQSLGNPWVNTIAADRDGNALYGDLSAIPHVTREQFDTCIFGQVAPLLTDFGLPTLDGSDSACEWGSDEDAPVHGVFGLASLPKIETRDYAANANDSYWLSNPDSLLEGFSPIIGREQVEQSRRTRATFAQAENRIAGTDGLGEPGFDIDSIRELHYQAWNFTADLVLDDVLTVCRGIPEDPLAGISREQVACDILGAWDRSHRVDSVGAHVFTEFWRVMRETDDPWSVPFDVADPVNTPRDLNIEDPAVADAVLEALTAGVERLSVAGIPLDRPWGEVQYEPRNADRFGIHGGSGDMMFSAIGASLKDGEGYTPIGGGNSIIVAVGWDGSECPDAYGILTYSQSTDPASPHFGDATELYSNSGWIDMPFCATDRDAQEIGRMTLSE